MNSLVLLAVGFVLVFVAYLTYGKFLAKTLKLNDENETPSHTKQDGVDYVPSRPQMLFGHHFASIAGAGPIVGPVLGAAFGWLPVYLWLIVGSIFMGAVHDFTSLVASIRHSGRSIGEVVEAHVGRTGKFLFLTFSWTTLIVICAAFMNICAQTFAEHPEAGTASIFFLVLAVLFGFAVYRRNFSMGISTVIGVTLLFICVWLGIQFPLQLSKTTWTWLLLAYISVASVTPVWVLLQPRDYLNSFLLYALILGAFIGVFVSHPTINLEAFTGFKQPIGYLFPILFVTVACGAISGFSQPRIVGHYIKTAQQGKRRADNRVRFHACGNHSCDSCHDYRGDADQGDVPGISCPERRRTDTAFFSGYRAFSGVHRHSRPLRGDYLFRADGVGLCADYPGYLRTACAVQFSGVFYPVGKGK